MKHLCQGALLSAFAASVCLPSAVCRAADVNPGQMFCLRDGRKLHYAEYGAPDGALVAYFHGTPGSHLEVGLIDEELAASGIRLISVNRPGMGRSTFDPGRRIVDWPADVAQLMNAVGGEGAACGIVGLSGGAPYALACARALGPRLTHVALVSGHTPPGVCVAPGNQDRRIELVRRHPRLGEFVVKRNSRQLANNPSRAVEKVTSSWSEVDRRAVLGDPQLKRRLIVNLHEATRCGPEGVAHDIVLLGSSWGFQVCEAAGVPISIWQGGCDPIVTLSMAKWFHKQLPGSTLHIDPQAGHVTMFKNHCREILGQFELR